MNDFFKKLQEVEFLLSKTKEAKAPGRLPEGHHEVEVHPHIDQLKRIKGHIQDSGLSSLKIAHLKKAGFSHNFLKNAVPKDANGWVTPEMIDEHIDKLPKQKVGIHVIPYTWGAQQHHPDALENVVKVTVHPSTLDKADPKTVKTWNEIKHSQHNFDAEHGLSMGDQVGWARIDPHSKPGHWHIDEIQSDFQNNDKIASHLANSRSKNANNYAHNLKADPNHPLHKLYTDADNAYTATTSVKRDTPEYKELWDKYTNKNKELSEALGQEINKHVAASASQSATPKDIHKLLSHGHEDPQHLIHSAINELARKHGVKSTSMDTPEDQAKQSHLSDYDDNEDDYNDEGDDDPHGSEAFRTHAENYIQNEMGPDKLKESASKNPNPNFKTAVDKLGHEDINKMMEELSYHHSDRAGDYIRDMLDDHKDKISEPEQHALYDYLNEHRLHMGDPDEGGVGDTANQPQADSVFDKAKLPVHQLDTYDKRPKKLGMKRVKKEDVMPGKSTEKDQEVQYSPVYKSAEVATQEQELIKFHSNGQWTLEKSSLEKDNSVKPFGQSVYNEKANVGRKMGRTGEERTDHGKNVAVQAYTSNANGTAAEQASRQAKADKEKSKKNPVKVYTAEEKAALAAKMGVGVSTKPAIDVDKKPKE